MTAHILVVEDSEFDQAFVKQMFRGMSRIRDWNAVYVFNGNEALDRLQEHPYDIILTDVNMPGMTGLQLLQKIRLLDIDTPVVIMTANGSEELVLDSLRSGAAHYVMKRKLAQELPKIIEKMARPVEKTARPVSVC